MAGTYLPLAALLLATAVALLLVGARSAAVPVAAAAADKYSGRMVIIRAPGARVVVSAGGALNKYDVDLPWEQQRRLVEDEVAPEFGGDQLLGGNLNYKGLNPDQQVCLKGQPCAADGQPYTGRPCGSTYQCNHTPVAGHARAVHV